MGHVGAAYDSALILQPLPRHEGLRHPGQVGEAADHRLGAGFGQLVGMAWPGVAAAGEADDAGTGGFCCTDAEDRILEDDRFAGRYAELIDRVEIDVWRRLRL